MHDSFFVERAELVDAVGQGADVYLGTVAVGVDNDALKCQNGQIFCVMLLRQAEFTSVIVKKNGGVGGK